MILIIIFPGKVGRVILNVSVWHSSVFVSQCQDYNHSSQHISSSKEEWMKTEILDITIFASVLDM